MFMLIKQLFSLLTARQRKRFLTLQILVILMALAEVIGIASIAPFMALVGDIKILDDDNMLASIYQWSGLSQPYDFVFWVGVAVLFALAIAALLSMFTVWKLSMFGAKVGTEIADRLYAHYLRQPWLFHASGNTSQLTKQISVEAVRVTDGIIQPLMQMNARIVLALFLSLAIFAYNPMVALTGLLFFVGAYICLYKLVRNRLHRNGQMLSQVATSRFRLLGEGFGGIKDVLLLNRERDFIRRFSQTGDQYAHARGNNNALQQVPRYFMELLAFGAMISLILFLIATHHDALGLILPTLSLYALAGFKLLPAFQQIYAALGHVKGNIAAFESIREDLMASQSEEFTEPVRQIETNAAKIKLSTGIRLQDITFTYPGKAEPALSKLNMHIPANKVIGIVGPSGSGKSTAIDILLGLIQPQQGRLIVEGEPLDDENRRAWQDIIGFVPQSIFLSDGSIAENVAFGIPADEIDNEHVEKAIRLAHLDDLVNALPQGLDTSVGERGIQLSGGQRQRIGIARALYHDADVLVFDEATSALDGITEKMIMDAIHDFGGNKTIIMIAHRLKTVVKCDTIFFLDKGKIIDQGNYSYLVEHNEQFRRMANHA